MGNEMDYQEKDRKSYVEGIKNHIKGAISKGTKGLATLILAGSVGLVSGCKTQEEYLTKLFENFEIPQIGNYEIGKTERINLDSVKGVIGRMDFYAYYTGNPELPGIIVLDIKGDEYKFKPSANFFQYNNLSRRNLEKIADRTVGYYDSDSTLFSEKGKENTLGIVIPYMELLEVSINKRDKTYQISISGSEGGGGGDGSGGAGAGAGSSGDGGSGGGDGGGGSG